MIRRVGLAPPTFLAFVVAQMVLIPTVVARAQLGISQDEAPGSPRIVLGSDPATGLRSIQISGRGVPVYPTIDIACDGRRWTLPLTRSGSGVAHGVSGSLVETILSAVDCRLFLPDREIALTRQQLWAAWADPARGSAPPPALVGQVLQVIDGNTILVNLGDRRETVRYIGINTKEVNRPPRSAEPAVGGAAEANRQLVARQQIRLELDVQVRDREGRLLAYVFVADTMVNAELVRRGAAEVMTIQPNVRHRELFVALEQEARDQRRGLWADPSKPTTPLSTADPPPQRATEQRAGGQNAEGQRAEERRGVAPAGTWTCPAPQPIKGETSTYTSGRCVYHLPDGEFYGVTHPERCYATVDDARQDGCIAARR